MRNLAPLFTLALLAMPGAAFAQASSAYNQPPPCRAEQDFSRRAEAIIAEEIDAARARGVPDAPALHPDAQLTRIAELRACELARAGKLTHLDDKGHLQAADIVFSVFAPYGLVGENLMRMKAAREPLNAETFAASAAELWLKSPEHRQHILDPRYDQSGIGVAMVNGEAVATQVFHGTPRRGRPPR